MNKEINGEEQEVVSPESQGDETPTGTSQEGITLGDLEQKGRTRSGRIRATNPDFRGMLENMETAVSEDAHGRTPKTPIKIRKRRTGRGKYGGSER